MGAPIIVCGSEEDPFRTTLEAFIGENEFDDSELSAIRSDLARTGSYRGGGGAIPVFLIFDAPETYEWARAA